MNAQILMTSPYAQMTKAIKELSIELDIPIIIVEGTVKAAGESVKRMVQENPSIEVIISRAGTLVEISKLDLGLPIIYCENSDFDILKGLWHAKTISKKIGFLCFQDKRFPYDFSKLSEILGSEINLYPYNNWEEIVQQVEKASLDGMEVIVGGGKGALEEIKKKNMIGIHVTTNHKTIQRAILLAQSIVEYRTQSRKQAQELQSILNISGEPIIVTDNRGMITYYNPTAETTFHYKASRAIGQYVKHLDPNLPLHQVFQEEPKKIISIDERKYLLEKLEIENENEDELIGTVYTLKEINKIQQMENNIRKELYHKGLVAKHTFSDIIYKSKKMDNIIKSAKKYSITSSTILVTGESGTGKELFAQSIHRESLRSNGPFVAVNCAAISDSLLESELFGYADGAFTGAKKGGRPGVFELAHGGTIFLDEIGEISMKIQTILLRVLQEREVMRVGGDRVIPVDVRVIAATNKNLWVQVQKGLFREDLFFRLNVLRLQIPPLRERKEDLPLLIDLLLNETEKSDIRWDYFPGNLKEILLEYSWPGNIRQLKNVVERLSLSLGKTMNFDEFLEEFQYEKEMTTTEVNYDGTKTIYPESNPNTLSIELGSLVEMESQIIKKVMQLNDHNRTLAADKLGISRTTLWKKLKIDH